MKILLAVDGSSCSEMAVDVVARRPWPAESEIKVVSVVERPTIAAMEPWEVPADYFTILEKVAHDKALAAATAASAKLSAAANQALALQWLSRPVHRSRRFWRRRKAGVLTLLWSARMATAPGNVSCSVRSL
jgi:hypothetical protein